MAHFAELDSNNIVLQVIVVNNEVLLDKTRKERASLGIAFCKSLYGADTNWVQTSYNATFGFNFAIPGGSYLPEPQAFIDEQPYPSWRLETVSYQWEPPIPKPADADGFYNWDEATKSWVKIS